MLPLISLQGSPSPKFGAKIWPYSHCQKVCFFPNSRWKIPNWTKFLISAIWFGFIQFGVFGSVFWVNNFQSTRILFRPWLIHTFLAHLSRRLTGELLVYPCSGVRRPSVVRPFTFSNIFFSKTAGPIKAKFYVEPPWVGGSKVCSRHPGHMTKMAIKPIYGKNPSKIFFSGTGRPISTKLGM